ncbi:unnamed protein product, partial [Symbiodinium microadriaticum]
FKATTLSQKLRVASAALAKCGDPKKATDHLLSILGKHAATRVGKWMRCLRQMPSEVQQEEICPEAMQPVMVGSHSGGVELEDAPPAPSIGFTPRVKTCRQRQCKRSVVATSPVRTAADIDLEFRAAVQQKGIDISSPDIVNIILKFGWHHLVNPGHEQGEGYVHAFGAVAHEFVKLLAASKAGTAPEVKQPTAPAASTSVPAPAGDGQEADVVMQDLNLQAEDKDEDDEDEDPIKQQALSEAMAEMDHIHVFRTLQEAAAAVADKQAKTQSKLGIIIDAQTSRIKVSVTYIDEVSKMLLQANINKYSVIVIAGPRLDLLAGIHARAVLTFKGDRVAVVQMTSGQVQTSKTQPGYLVSIHSQALLKAETPNKNVEIDEDDREAASFEMAQDAPAAPEDALPEIPTINAEEDQDAYVLLDRPSEHSVRHGREVAVSYFKQMVERKLLQAGGQRRKRKLQMDDISVMTGPTVSAESQQVMEFLEIPPAADDRFAGVPWVDMLPPNLDSMIHGIAERDLDEHGLFVQASGNRGLSLYTHQSVPDGEVVLKPSFLLYSSEKTLVEFLRQNETYADKVLKISGILHHDKPTTMFAVLLGAARMINDFSGGSRKSPNCEWALIPAIGPSR